MTLWLQSKTTIPATSGNPEDSVVHTFAWLDPDSTGDGVAEANIAVSKINTFMTSLTATSIIRYPTYLKLNEAVTEVYNLQHSRPRIPIVTTEHTGIALPTDIGGHLPPEVALVVSYGAAKASGQNPRRRRGRFYFGPLQISGAVGGTDYVRPRVDACQQLLDSFVAYIGGAQHPWLAVYSRYTHGGLAVGEHPPDNQPFPEQPELLPASFVAATQFYVDDAWDTQRRRGLDATQRVSVGVTELDRRRDFNDGVEAIPRFRSRVQ